MSRIEQTRTASTQPDQEQEKVVATPQVSGASAEFQTKEQRLHAEIATFLKEELQNITIPLHMRVAKGFRLAAKLRLSEAGWGTLVRNFHVFERPVQEWPGGLQKIYKGGFRTATVQTISPRKTSAQTIEALDIIKAHHPMAPLKLPALMLAVSSSRGTGDFDTYCNGRLNALKVVPPQLRSLVFIEISAHAATHEFIYDVVSNLLDTSVMGSVVSNARLEDLFLASIQTAGYHEAVCAYMTEQEQQLLNPTLEIPHPMDLWRAATEPLYLQQRQSYSATHFGFAGVERNRVVKLLIAEEYDAALEALRAVSSKFPKVVLAQYLDRAEGAGEQ